MGRNPGRSDYGVSDLYAITCSVRPPLKSACRLVLSERHRRAIGRVAARAIAHRIVQTAFADKMVKVNSPS